VHLQSVGAVLVHYRSEDSLFDVVKTLLNLGIAEDHVVVVDNGSEPEFGKLLCDTFPALRYHPRPDNPGYAVAANLGLVILARLGVAIGVVATHEIEVRRLRLDAVLRRFEDDPKLGLLGPLVMTGGSDDVWSRGGSISRLTLSYNTLLTAEDVADREDPYSVGWIDGCFMLVRLEAWDQVGGLDERYFLYVEEIDFAWRLRVSGWRVAVDASMIVSQRPGDYPRYLAIRNNAIFVWTHGHALSRSLWSLYNVAAVGRGLVSGRDARQKSLERLRALRDARQLAG
jgi:GT2 family glycosyltransferase